MNHPQITFRHMEVSPAVEARVRQEVEALQQCFERITSCRVVIEAPHNHHLHGQEFQVSIDLHVPGSQIIVNHVPSSPAITSGSETVTSSKSLEAQPEHKDIYISIRDAFAAARRQLKDYAQVLRGETKRHRVTAEAA